MAILWFAEKQSTTCMYLCRKAFFGRIPFPTIFVDNGHDFHETYEFRDRIVEEWSVDISVLRVEGHRNIICGVLDLIEEEYDVDGLIISMKRGDSASWFEEANSPRSGKIMKCGDLFCISPLICWSEIDVWRYIKGEGIRVNPLYFAKDGKRYENRGHPTLAVSIASGAEDVDAIIEELALKADSNGNERATDDETENVMQRLRDLGYM
jgi:sulfate adenylyltransferase subunit 2